GGVAPFGRGARPEEGDTLIRRDNTFGSPEEDAFRRDFTVNALFYDLATFSVIDFVGGLEDLQDRVIRTIGDPAVRFREDPVRMLRAVALAARLGFTIDRDSMEAIRFLRGGIVKSSPARMLDEAYKILRQGASRQTFQMLHEAGLLAYLLPEADQAIAEQGERLLGSLARLDDYRNAGLAAPDELTNALLMGTLLVPLGVPLRRAVAAAAAARRQEEPETAEDRLDVAAEMAALGGDDGDEGGAAERMPLVLPFARRDLDRLRLVLAAQSRLREVHTSPKVKHLLAGRGYLEEALRWMEIHGGVQGQELAAYWRGLDLEVPAPAANGETAAPAAGDRDAPRPPRPRRRRRRRPRRRPGSSSSTPVPSA